jgi:leader peptidase (prepilin peptidase)/N-methyltransferase
MNYLLIILFGLVIGSFLNVCIYRIPRDGSIMSPSRSYCPHCNHQLGALDNIPVFSYIFLRGKCQYCKGNISPRYMIVELLTAGIFALILYKGMSLHQSQFNVAMYILKACIFSAFLIVISFIDIDYEEIPDKVVYPGLGIGFLLMVYMSIMNKDIKLIAFSVLGAVAGALVIILIAIIGKAIFRKEAMGGGDITLMAMIGMYVGLWPSIPLTIILSSILGSIVGMILIAFRKKSSDGHIPFGPFLSTGALITILYGNELWSLYKHLMRL